MTITHEVVRTEIKNVTDSILDKRDAVLTGDDTARVLFEIARELLWMGNAYKDGIYYNVTVNDTGEVSK